jgi:hypothetical protein
MKVKIVKPCVNQDTKKRLKPGDIVDNFSAFELGRHFAEGNAIPIRDAMEQAVNEPTETRRTYPVKAQARGKRKP